VAALAEAAQFELGPASAPLFGDEHPARKAATKPAPIIAFAIDAREALCICIS